jgi:hypothetical protein
MMPAIMPVTVMSIATIRTVTVLIVSCLLAANFAFEFAFRRVDLLVERGDRLLKAVPRRINLGVEHSGRLVEVVLGGHVGPSDRGQQRHHGVGAVSTQRLLRPLVELAPRNGVAVVDIDRPGWRDPSGGESAPKPRGSSTITLVLPAESPTAVLATLPACGGQLGHRGLYVGGDVQHRALRHVGVQREPQRCADVVDVHEVARRLPVAVDQRRLAGWRARKNAVTAPFGALLVDSAAHLDLRGMSSKPRVLYTVLHAGAVRSGASRPGWPFRDRRR